MGIFKNNDLKRAIALVIDSFFINFSYNLIFNQNYLSNLSGLNFNYLLLSFLLYFMIFDFFNNGETLGKLMLKVEVNKKLSLKKRISRSFLKLVSIYITPITIIIYLSNKNILHDTLFNSNEVIHN